MNVSTVKRIGRRSAIAKEVLTQYLKNNPSAELFQTYFHLRPTSKGITIVSTLPTAPMRGISVKNADELQNTLEQLGTLLPQLVDADFEQVVEALRPFGFKKRSTKSFREEDIQATFIRRMMSHDPAYQNIQFVASELTLERNKRLDVVGYRSSDDTLFLFEMKKGRKTAATTQVLNYREHIEKHREHFAEVFSVYPNFPVNGFSNIQCVTVMKFDENSPTSVWENTVTAHDVAIWMYDRELNFPERYAR